MGLLLAGNGHFRLLFYSHFSGNERLSNTGNWRKITPAPRRAADHMAAAVQAVQYNAADCFVITRGNRHTVRNKLLIYEDRWHIL